jgi:hypothetical protein
LRNAVVSTAEQAASRRRGSGTLPAQPARTPAFRIVANDLDESVKHLYESVNYLDESSHYLY